MSYVSKATWGYKDGEDAHRSVKKALQEIGVYVYDSPACEGSDAFGLIFSNGPLSDKEIEDIDDIE